MTRINVVPVQELVDKHLLAEYREIMRMPKVLDNTLNRRSKPFSMSEIPSQYVLGTGHVKFFFDKFTYLTNRFTQLANELINRNFNIDQTLYSTMLQQFKQVPAKFQNDYTPTIQALALNRARINDRLQ